MPTVEIACIVFFYVLRFQLLARRLMETEWLTLYERVKLKPRRVKRTVTAAAEAMSPVAASTALSSSSGQHRTRAIAIDMSRCAVLGCDDAVLLALQQSPLYRVHEVAVDVFALYLRLMIATADVAGMCNDSLFTRVYTQQPEARR